MHAPDQSADPVVSSSLATDAAFDVEVLRARASGENFPVAMRILPRAFREDLLAVYSAARLIDETGDSLNRSPAERLALLDEVERDLLAAFEGRSEHPVFSELTSTIRRCDLEPDPFLRLIEANRFDQQRVDLEHWDDLMAYCALSANPIGELVLRISGQTSAAQIQLADEVCSALQVIEHCQDVAEDRRSGRIYLPRLDRTLAGCADPDLTCVPATMALRSLIESQIVRSRTLLASGGMLCTTLRGAARIAVSGFIAGGLATCDALERTGFDPNSNRIKRRRRDFMRHFCRLSWTALRGRSVGVEKAPLR